MKRILLSIFIIGFVAAGIGGATFSTFQSSASVEDNNFSTGTWYTGSDVVINELMWMGSWNGENDPSDEWIELRNMTGSPIDISGWQLTRVSGNPLTEHLMLTIPDSSSIPANGFFLITQKSKSHSAINVDPNWATSNLILANSNLQIKLYKGLWTNSTNLLDTAGNGGIPLAGLISGMYRKSMARNNDPGDGTLGANWHTTIDESANDTTYWKIEGSNYGTPGGPNV
jgi:predicted ribosomally synthesized peptide with SipW-like signal peptide